tara:strand:- start:2261 stop:2641 length:381 start_codon:yes stop_codon:yes gene_type:complete
MPNQNGLDRQFNLLKDFRYLLARALKRSRPAAIRNSAVHITSKIEPGSQVVGSEFERHSYCGYDCVFLNTSVGAFCSISDNVVVGGNPAPVLRWRFSQEIIDRLLASKWWDLSDKEPSERAVICWS